MVFELRITVSNVTIAILLLVGVMILFSSIKTEKKATYFAEKPRLFLLPRFCREERKRFGQDFVEKKESALAIRSIQFTAMKDLGSNGPHENCPFFHF